MQKFFSSLKFQDVLASLIVASIVVYFFWVSRPGVPASPNVAEIKQILGGVLMLTVSFYFGSSKSSANKDQTISDAINGKTVTQ